MGSSAFTSAGDLSRAMLLRAPRRRCSGQGSRSRLYSGVAASTRSTNQRSSQACFLRAGCWGPESNAPEEQRGFARVTGVVGTGQARFVTGRNVGGYRGTPGAARGRRKIKKD